MHGPGDVAADYLWASMLLSLPIVAIIGGITYAIFGLRHKARLQELAYRERIARIERGLAPAPEVDPAGFERSWNAFAEETPNRLLSGGITLVGVGLGLMVMLWFLTNEPRIGLGVGGFLAIMGVALIVNAAVQRGPRRPMPPTVPASHPQPADGNPPQRREYGRDRE